MGRYYILLDVGGTQIKAGIFGEDGMLQGKIRSFPAKSREPKEVILAHFCSVIRTMYQENAALAQLAADEELAGIGMAFPGPFDYENGISLMRGLDKYDAIYGVPLGKVLIQRLPGLVQTRMTFVHDVEAFAVGCAKEGAAAGAGKAIVLCIGTGAGSAFLENGEVRKKAGKTVPENGWIYQTPFRDSCIDDYLSVRGLERISRRILGRKTDGEELYRLCQAGDEKALAVYREFGKILDECIRPFLMGFAPDAMVLGGQISKSFVYFGQNVKSTCNHLNIKIIMEENTSFRTMQGLYYKCKNNL